MKALLLVTTTLALIAALGGSTLACGVSLGIAFGIAFGVAFAFGPSGRRWLMDGVPGAGAGSSGQGDPSPWGELHDPCAQGELQDSPGIHLAYADLSRWLAFFGAKNKEIPSDVVGPLKKYRAHFKALNIWGLVTAILCFCTILLAFAFGVLLLLRDQFNPEHAKLILSAIWWTSLMICALLALMATIFVILAAPPDLPKPISQMMKTSLSIGWAYILFWFGVLSTVGAGLLARLLLGRMTAAPTAPHAAPPATVPYAS